MRLRNAMVISALQRNATFLLSGILIARLELECVLE
jgi:hypothetical protein